MLQIISFIRHETSGLSSLSQTNSPPRPNPQPRANKPTSSRHAPTTCLPTLKAPVPPLLYHDCASPFLHSVTVKRHQSQHCDTDYPSLARHQLSPTKWTTVPPPVLYQGKSTEPRIDGRRNFTSFGPWPGAPSRTTAMACFACSRLRISSSRILRAGKQCIP